MLQSSFPQLYIISILSTFLIGVNLCCMTLGAFFTININSISFTFLPCSYWVQGPNIRWVPDAMALSPGYRWRVFLWRSGTTTIPQNRAGPGLPTSQPAIVLWYSYVGVFYSSKEIIYLSVFYAQMKKINVIEFKSITSDSCEINVISLKGVFLFKLH